MRTFERFPKENKCPICNTNENKECVLISIVGTGDNPDKKFQNYEAKVFHLDCIELWYDKSGNIIYQRVVVPAGTKVCINCGSKEDLTETDVKGSKEYLCPSCIERVK